MKTIRNQMKRKAIMFALFIACCLITIGNCFAQNVGISPTGLNPDNSAGLDVNFPDKGLLIPRMTEAQRNLIPSPAEGLQIYNTSTKCVNLWIGSTWKQICGDCDFNSPIPGNNGPICQGFTLNLTATAILGATYLWSGPNGFTSTLQNPSISNTTQAASGSYSVTATKNGCTCQPQSTVATVNSTPVTPTAGNDGPKCVGELLNLTATTVVGATYNWAGPNGYSSSLQNPIITSVALTNAGTYNVTATVNGCISAAGTTTVTVNAIPATPGSISGSASTCPNSIGNVYSISVVSGATSYTWTIPSGTITAGQGTTSITVTFGASIGNVTVTASNACGTSSASSITVTSGICGSGGTMTNVGGYTIHTFTTSGTLTTSGSGNVEALVVAGGGGGGGYYYAGGGGAGGLIYNPALAVTAQTYTVTVGGGGAGGGTGANGTNGGNSVFSSLTAYGGGGGGGYSKAGLTGGSGGGAGGDQGLSLIGGTAPYGQGYAGGNTTYPSSSTGGYGAGAGGGGAGGVGESISGSYTIGANGGVGLSYSISGSATYYAGGGGGGAGWNTACNGGIGGAGGGGNGANARGTAATIGTANTGGGGGGGQHTGGGGDQTGKTGGSGIVIIRYPN